jgi:hypothetical protein
MRMDGHVREPQIILPGELMSIYFITALVIRLRELAMKHVDLLGDMLLSSIYSSAYVRDRDNIIDVNNCLLEGANAKLIAIA